MGNKTNPIGVRLLINSGWDDSVFMRSKDYTELFFLSFKVKAYLMMRYKFCGLISVNIKQEDGGYVVVLNIENEDAFWCRVGQTAEQIGDELRGWFWADASLVVKQLEDVRFHPAVIASKLIADISNNSTIKASVKQVAKPLIGSGIIGLKASYAGRIYGVDIAQTVWHIEGRVPLHTLSADIRYASVSVKTNYGICNVKVWVCVSDFTAERIEAQEDEAES
ncbi:MAG: 30S ribosomal protein S3 [Candidatus Hodgkinia cicadicola]